MNNVIKIGVVGPESTGKSELCHFLATYFKTQWVPEYSREYLARLSRPYTINDIIAINEGQVKSELELIKISSTFLFCDTTPLVNKIWCEFKYGFCPPEIETSLINTLYDFHLLCYIDLPWQEDPLREHPDKREELFNLYEKALLDYNKEYVIIKGLNENRFQNAVTALKAKFQPIFFERKFE